MERTKDVVGLGEIRQWPGGYAMTLGREWTGGYAVTCCSGHRAPQDAKNHGLVRLVEIASAVADRDCAQWAARPAEEAS